MDDKKQIWIDRYPCGNTGITYGLLYMTKEAFDTCRRTNDISSQKNSLVLRRSATYRDRGAHLPCLDLTDPEGPWYVSPVDLPIVSDICDRLAGVLASKVKPEGEFSIDQFGHYLKRWNSGTCPVSPECLATIGGENPKKGWTLLTVQEGIKVVTALMETGCAEDWLGVEPYTRIEALYKWITSGMNVNYDMINEANPFK